MDKEKANAFMHDSIIAPLLSIESLTDITYNGKDIFYCTNNEGRKKSEISITQDDAKFFVRQLSNFCDKQFSFSSPILDVSFGSYRINALHQSVGKVENSDAISFVISRMVLVSL